MATHYLACDLGAESGRLILGTLDQEQLRLEELHRFVNQPIKRNGSLHWDMARLLAELKTGLKKAAALQLPISSISTDSWGVDYLLLDANGEWIEPTFHYRDPRTKQGVERTLAAVDWKTIFSETGIQFMVLNSIFQLAAESPGRLQRAGVILGIGDAFNYFLSGRAWAEESLASTTQLYNPRSKSWSRRLLQALDLPERIFPPIVPSGTPMGPMLPAWAEESGLHHVQVIASCSHDTGAAVAAVPAREGNWAYLSSGTWSLMGVELNHPIINERSRSLNFTNEIGFGGSVRLLKNIIGLWVVQECRREWSQSGHDLDYAHLTELAGRAPAFVSLINPADARFLGPGGMPEKIRGYCRETRQPEPADPGATVRCALESLALLYRKTLLQIEELLEKKIECLHIVGGGSRNVLLNQFTASALNIPIVTGPVEATAAGNILIQAIALGHIPSLTEARRIVRNSFDVAPVQPAPSADWDAAYERFLRLP